MAADVAPYNLMAVFMEVYERSGWSYCIGYGSFAGDWAGLRAGVGAGGSFGRFGGAEC